MVSAKAIFRGWSVWNSQSRPSGREPDGGAQGSDGAERLPARGSVIALADTSCATLHALLPQGASASRPSS